ncbi:MAG: hypothetical protein JXR95_08670 [Deltaproteobacteria bacterium]|nr:hypothetical protein [Deltaproteobacteria bacterium]
MENLSKYYPLIINLAMIALVNSGAGIAAADITAYFLYSAPVYEMAAKGISKKSSKRKNEKRLSGDIRAILKRNMFCSTCEPISLDDIKDAGGKQPEKKVDSLEGATLLSTMLAEREIFSLAAIAVEKPEVRTILVGINDEVGGAKVIMIEDKKVTFLKDGKEKILTLTGEPKTIASKSSTPGKPKTKDEEWASKIKQIGPNKYEVERSVVMDLMQTMAQRGRGAMVIPDPKGGFRVSFIRSYSIFYKLGIRSGDVIKSVNNIQLDSFDKALLMYTKLKNANHLTISINRRGKTENMDFSIR